ncbi:MAG: hypothetical protein IJR58_03880 [Lachnospiraceae bacterium]|nr:hypothetical protein [Lachnospiraceae bacterium]
MKKRFLTLLAAMTAFATLTFGALTVNAAGRPVTIKSCEIQGDQVVVTVSASSVPGGDGNFYLYANEVYQDGATGKVVATAKAGKSATFTFPLNKNTADSNLSRKFLVATKSGGGSVQVSDEHYITNPEASSAVSAARIPAGIKGLLPDGQIANSTDLKDLGIQQVVANMHMSDIVGETTNPAFPTIVYPYDGVEYRFNGFMMQSYANLMKFYNGQGIAVTMTLINDKAAHTADLLHPLARDAHVSPGYAFNTVEPAGTAHLKAIAAFLGQYFNGATGHGQIDNWVVGNEVNARTEWYYTSSTDLDYNVNAYVKAFRIFYNGIKSENASARIYNSIDQEWGRLSNPGCLLAKGYLDRFNYYMRREGNIDWGLSFHPYNSPLFDPYGWMGQKVWVRNDVTTPYITMQNINILTDYMQKPEFLNPAGAVRSISLSEIGFTSSFGQDLQDASIVFGYLKAKNNPYIDSFMLFRLNDHPHEMLSNIAQGLRTVDGSKKSSYDFYRAMGTPEEAAYAARASAIMGQDVYALVKSGAVLTR